MGRVNQSVVVPLAPERARALWLDVQRWTSFVDGFRRARRVDSGWPAPGSSVEWESGAGGRGLVTERVERNEPGRVATRVVEEALSGTQAATFEAEDGETRVELELDYALTRGGPLGGLTDWLFIRRAQSDSLARTLKRFAAEAAEESAL